MFGTFYQPQIIGNLARATSFSEVQSAPIPANGSPTLFLIADEPAMYMVSMQNGTKLIQGYTITPMPTKQEATEQRINNLEAMLLEMKQMLEGKMNNESNSEKPDTANQQS